MLCCHNASFPAENTHILILDFYHIKETKRLDIDVTSMFIMNISFISDVHWGGVA